MCHSNMSGNYAIVETNYRQGTNPGASHPGNGIQIAGANSSITVDIL